MSRRFGPLFVTLLLFAHPSLAQEGEQEAGAGGEAAAISAATSASESWLAIVDSAGWHASYTEASQLFKSAVAPDVWIQQIRAARTPFGPFVSRTLTGSHYATSLPGAPDGEYVVLTYSAKYTKKAYAIETVTPMKDTDGAWRVSGYYVR